MSRSPSPDSTLYSYTLGGRTRTFWLHAPPGVTPATPLPLMFVFHGTGGVAKKTEVSSGMDAYANMLGFRVAYPEVVDGQTQWVDPSDPDLAVTIQAVLAGKGWGISKMFVVGHSEGGGQAQRVAAKHKGSIAFVAVMNQVTAPSFWKPFGGPPPPTPFVYFHGDDDDISAPSGAMPTAQMWAQNNKCPTALVVPKAVAVPGARLYHWDHPTGATVDYYLIPGGKHVWPGAIGGAETLPVASQIIAYQAMGMPVPLAHARAAP